MTHWLLTGTARLPPQQHGVGDRLVNEYRAQGGRTIVPAMLQADGYCADFGTRSARSDWIDDARIRITAYGIAATDLVVGPRVTNRPIRCDPAEL